MGCYPTLCEETADSNISKFLFLISAHSCPWEVTQYFGKARSYPLFDAAPAFLGASCCFPGGYASSGFAVIALFFLFYPQSRAWLRGAGPAAWGTAS